MASAGGAADAAGASSTPESTPLPPAPVTASSGAFQSLRTHLKQPSTSVLLPDAYINAEEYLLKTSFHSSMKFRPSWLQEGEPDHRLTYALAGSAEPDAPVLVWLNGLGGHRLAASFLDGICDEHDIRLISLDRPSSGGSTPVPLSHRFAWTHEALLALFGKLSITRFSILSHSNGDLYTLYTLLHLPPELTVDSWVLSSPYVPPWLSGSIPLSIARYIPAGATGSLGTLLSGVMKAESWSTGTASDLLAFSGGLSAGLTSVSAGTGWGKGGGVAPPTAGEAKEEESELERGDSQERKFIQFALRQADKEEHCRVYGGRFYPPEMFQIGMSWVLAEGFDAWGAEALVCLRKGEAASWGWGEGAEGEPVDDSLLFERGFGALKLKYEEERKELPHLEVWYGAEDGLIPAKGREYMRSLLVDRLKLVKEDAFHTIPSAGHDDTISLDCVMVPLLRSVRAMALSRRAE